MKTIAFKFNYNKYKERIKTIDEVSKKLPHLKNFEIYSLYNNIKAFETDKKLVFIINYKEDFFGNDIIEINYWINNVISVIKKIRKLNRKILKKEVNIIYKRKKKNFIHYKPYVPDSFYLIEPFIKYLQLKKDEARVILKIEKIKIHIDLKYDIPHTKVIIEIQKKLVKDKKNEKKGENHTSNSKNSKT